MSYVKLFLLGSLLVICGCKDITDDLNPSGTDRRSTVMAGSIGSQVGQQAPEFTALDTVEVSHTLTDELTMADGIVLYFTMWCPICDSHMEHIRSNLIPDFPDIQFLIVDYVTGSVKASRATQISNGYSSMTVLADIDHSLLDAFKGNMGVTVIIDSEGIIKLNEDYKNGQKVRATLEALD